MDDQSYLEPYRSEGSCGLVSWNHLYSRVLISPVLLHRDPLFGSCLHSRLPEKCYIIANSRSFPAKNLADRIGVTGMMPDGETIVQSKRKSWSLPSLHQPDLASYITLVLIDWFFYRAEVETHDFVSFYLFRWSDIAYVGDKYCHQIFFSFFLYTTHLFCYFYCSGCVFQTSS